jgi:long-chain acyl-CoA synthetase
MARVSMRGEVPTTWVFDVDASLFDSFTGSSLRPGAHELLTELHATSGRVLLWSAGGAEYARARATQHGIADLFHGFHDKEGRDERGRYLVGAFLDGLAGVVFVDDRPEDLPEGAEIVVVPPYIAPNEHDRGLVRVAARAGFSLEV